MGHFTYPSGTPLGTVPFGYVVPSGEWQSTIRQVFRAINGDEGGTWAPSTFIVIGGSGFSLTGTGHQIAANARLTVQSTGEIRVANGGLVRLDGSGGDILLKVAGNIATIEVESGALVQVNAGGALDVYGAITFKTVGSATWQTGCSASFSSGSTLNLNSGSVTNGNGAYRNYGTITVKSTGDITFESGGAMVSVAGATMTWGGTMIVSGDFTLLGSSQWINLSPDRALTRVAFDLIPLSYTFVTGVRTTPDVFWLQALSTNAPAVFTDPKLASGSESIILLLDLPIGAVLESVVLTTQGDIEAGSGLVLPTYRIVSWANGAAAGRTNHSSTVTDVHDASNWLTSDEDTTVTASGGGVTIEAGRQYGIYFVHPYNLSGITGPAVCITQILVGLSADKITLQ